MGVSDCDNMLMLLGVSNRLTQRQRDVVTPLVIKGFGGKHGIHVCPYMHSLRLSVAQISAMKLVVLAMVVSQ